MEKTCAECGKTFETNYPGKKYCSKECVALVKRRVEREKYRAKVKLTKKICSACGKEFKPQSLHWKYCSDECCLRAKHKRENKAYKANKSLTKKCARCGVEFKVSVKNSEQLFCSRQCAQAIRRKPTAKTSKAPLVKICGVCGKEFKPDLYHPYQKYCGEECVRAAAKEHRKDYAERELKRREAEAALKAEQQSRLDKWVKEATLCGMSYGQYRAAREQLGKTFEELRIK